MQIKSFFQTMSDAQEIKINRWVPDSEEEVKGIVVLNHGLAEHSMRYDRLGSILVENGWILNAHDMRGHGATAENAVAKNKGLFGKLADNDGFNRVIEDLKEIIESIKKEYPDNKIILLGHSFGSFVSQGFIEDYGNLIDGCILCGTAGPRNGTVAIGKLFVDTVSLFNNSDKIVPLLGKIAFGNYNAHIKNPLSENAWLSRNELNVRMYEDDKWCGFPLTVSFYVDMMKGLKYIHKPNNIKKIPVDLPILFIYGTEDPVGSYGKTIESLFAIYKSNGIKNVQLKAYKDDRHEIFNEVDKENVETDVINWLCNLTK